MTRLQVRFPCPVCLGVKLEKADVSQTPPLQIDHCGRCGGVWFEAGEVAQLRKVEPRVLWSQIAQRDGVYAMQCHQCQSHIPRSEQHCKVCGWKVVLDCPICTRPMEQAQEAGIHLDACRHCRGVWFDHDELAAVWKMNLQATTRRGGTVGAGSMVLLDALTYDPFLAYFGIQAAGHAISGAAHLASNAPEIVGNVAGAASEVASSVFETILEIISGFFD